MKELRKPNSTSPFVPPDKCMYKHRAAASRCSTNGGLYRLTISAPEICSPITDSIVCPIHRDELVEQLAISEEFVVDWSINETTKKD